MCALELARHLLEAEPARPCSRQFIRRREPQVVCRVHPVPHRLSAFTGCLSSVRPPPGMVVGRLGAIGSRPCPIPPGPQQDVLPALHTASSCRSCRRAERITTLRATITKRGSAITLLRRSQPRRGTLVAHRGHGGTVTSRPLTRPSAPVIDEPVATGREIIVSSVLILIRASLIARTRRLVVVRPRLILITRRLVVVRPHLILVPPRLTRIRRRLITVLTDGTRQQLVSTRRTARNRAYFAAGRAPHNLCHCLVLLPRERARTNRSRRPRHGPCMNRLQLMTGTQGSLGPEDRTGDRTLSLESPISRVPLDSTMRYRLSVKPVDAPGRNRTSTTWSRDLARGVSGSRRQPIRGHRGEGEPTEVRRRFRRAATDPRRRRLPRRARPGRGIIYLNEHADAYTVVHELVGPRIVGRQGAIGPATFAPMTKGRSCCDRAHPGSQPCDLTRHND